MFGGHESVVAGVSRAPQIVAPVNLPLWAVRRLPVPLAAPPAIAGRHSWSGTALFCAASATETASPPSLPQLVGATGPIPAIVSRPIR